MGIMQMCHLRPKEAYTKVSRKSAET